MRGEIEEDDSAVAITQAADDIRLERSADRSSALIQRSSATLGKPFYPPTNCRHHLSPWLRMVLDTRTPTPTATSPNSAAPPYVPPSRLSDDARRCHSGPTARKGARCSSRTDIPRFVSSASHIADLLGDRQVVRSRTTRATWREVLSELGWQHERLAGVADDLLTVLATSGKAAVKVQTPTSSADQ